MITLIDWITSSGTYKDRQRSPELTNAVINNAQALLTKVNALLTDLNWGKTCTISSGFRPSSINAQIANAAKKSAHMSGNAVDILDDKAQTLGHLIASRPDLLRKHGLFLEALTSTVGHHSNWVHLDCVNRADRPSRIFQP